MSVATRTWNRPLSKSGQGLGSLGLSAAAVNASIRNDMLIEEIGQAVGPVPSPGEGQDAGGRLLPQDLQKQAGLESRWYC